MQKEKAECTSRSPTVQRSPPKEIFVPGIPVPKGSARAFFNKKLGRSFVVQTNAERQKPWASMISLTAQEAGLTPCSQGVSLILTFYMPRPKNHFRSNGSLKPVSESTEHLKKPDLDKLIRCVLDALTGIAYLDDSQVLRIDALKCYSSVSGCSIVIEEG